MEARFPYPTKLDAETTWARHVVTQEFGTLAPFHDPAGSGVQEGRSRFSFQRATAISKRVPYGDIHSTDFTDLYVQAAARLRSVYVAQASGRDLSDADQRELEIVATLDPRKTAGMRQGYGLSAPARRAVEQRAMDVAAHFLTSKGYTIKDVSSSKPFDFEAAMRRALLKVEVKGTTSDRADAILMTRNEVELHRQEGGEMLLSSCLASGSWRTKVRTRLLAEMWSASLHGMLTNGSMNQQPSA